MRDEQRCKDLARIISVTDVPARPLQDMASEERKAHDRSILEQNLFNARGAGQTASETDQFKCGRCKQRKCTYYRKLEVLKFGIC